MGILPDVQGDRPNADSDPNPNAYRHANPNPDGYPYAIADAYAAADPYTLPLRNELLGTVQRSLSGSVANADAGTDADAHPYAYPDADAYPDAHPYAYSASGAAVWTGHGSRKSSRSTDS